MAKRWYVWKNLKTSGRPQVYYIQGETLEEAWENSPVPSGPIDQSYSVVEAQHIQRYSHEVVLTRGERQ